ncbi:MAG: hypothetical protein M1839_008342 [Geoglossum umbratile]|nr:MAG: hypothetical protein M1839_008342 [Geoglossum umbratile]
MVNNGTNTTSTSIRLNNITIDPSFNIVISTPLPTNELGTVVTTITQSDPIAMTNFTTVVAYPTSYVDPYGYAYKVNGAFKTTASDGSTGCMTQDYDSVGTPLPPHSLTTIHASSVEAPNSLGVGFVAWWVEKRVRNAGVLFPDVGPIQTCDEEPPDPPAAHMLIAASYLTETSIQYYTSQAAPGGFAKSNYPDLTMTSQTLTAGDPVTTADEAPFSPTAAATVSASTTPLDSVGTALPVIIVIADTPIAIPPSASSIVIGSQTLLPGSPAITISETPISLVPGAANVIVGSNTIPLTPASPGILASPPIITIAGTPITIPPSVSSLIIGGQTLFPAGPAITVSGTLISLAPSASYILLGSTNTIPLPKPTNPAYLMTSPPLLTFGSSTYTANSLSQFIIGGQTLVPGGPAITVSGTRISIASGATSVVVGTSTAREAGSEKSGAGRVGWRDRWVVIVGGWAAAAGALLVCW